MLLDHFNVCQQLSDSLSLHGYGLLPRNKLPEGFVIGGNLRLRESSFAADFYNVSARTFPVAPSPRAGVFYTFRNGYSYVLDDAFATIATISSPSVTGVYLNTGGRCAVDYSGNALFVCDNTLRVVDKDGAIKSENPATGIYGNSGEFHFIASNSKKDIFAFSCYKDGVGRRLFIGKLSTLEIITEIALVSSDSNGIFLEDGRFVHVIENLVSGTNGISADVYEFDLTTYAQLSKRRLTLPSSHTGRFLGLNKSGKMVVHDKTNNRIYSIDIDSEFYEVLMTGITSTHMFTDFDKEYYYAMRYNYSDYYILDSTTGDTVIQGTTGYSTYPQPVQTRGKMPECKQFH